VTGAPVPGASDGPHGGPNQRNSKGAYDALPGHVVNCLPTPTASDGTGGPGNGGRDGGLNLRTAVTTLPETGPVQDWAEYGPAVRQWESVTGVPAPLPTETGPRGGRRLHAPFPEWMMGLAPGRVTSPEIGLTRSEQLSRIGNGVLPAQAEAAFAYLLSTLDTPVSELSYSPDTNTEERGSVEKVECTGCGNEYKKTKSGAPYAHKCVPKPTAEDPTGMPTSLADQDALLAKYAGDSVPAASGPFAAMATELGASPTAAQALEMSTRREGGAAAEAVRLEALLNSQTRDPFAVAPQPVVPEDVDETTGQQNTAAPRKHCSPGACSGCCGCSAQCTNAPCGRPYNVMYPPQPPGVAGQVLPPDLYPNTTETPAANWNGTGRPKPSAATVSVPEQSTPPQGPRLLDTLKQAAQVSPAVNGHAPQPQQNSPMADVMAYLGGGAPAAPQTPQMPAAPQNSSSADVMAYLNGGAPSAPAQPQQNSPMDDVMSFLRGGAPAPNTSELLNANGKPVPFDGSTPDANRDHTNRDGYLIRQPDTGEFRRYKAGHVKGIRRCTTLVKAASDKTALTDWAERNVLVGASRRPDLVMQANRLDVTEDRDRLNDLVEQLKDAAGAKVSASVGTAVHTLTEQIDAGLITMEQVPVMYRQHVQSYVNALRDAGLEVVPSLIEGTIYMPRWGGVAGKFDRILYHRASGTYRIADLKTGQNLTYGWDEIEAQEWVYTEGYNLFGTYDWGTDTWTPPQFRIATDYGVVMHLPVQGDDAGKCTLLRTDLERGARVAELCGAVIEGRSLKGKPEAWTEPARDWEASFAGVSSMEEAGALWDLAAESGVDAARLGALVAIAQRALMPPQRDWAAEFSQVPDMAAAGRLWEEANASGMAVSEVARMVAIAQESLARRGLTV